MMLFLIAQCLDEGRFGRKDRKGPQNPYWLELLEAYPHPSALRPFSPQNGEQASSVVGVFCFYRKCSLIAGGFQHLTPLPLC